MPARPTGCSREIGTKDSTFGIFEMDDGAIWSMNICWALPEIWPGSVYGIEIGIVGDKGVIDIEDTHRDLVLASEVRAGRRLQPGRFCAGRATPCRLPDLLSAGRHAYEPALGADARGDHLLVPAHLYGHATPHATAADGHRNLLLTMAMDLSARLGRPVPLPIETAELMAA